VTLLRELVAIPSVNPLEFEPGGRESVAGGTGELAGEKRVVDYLEHVVRSLGLPYERYDVLAFRPDLVARLKGVSPVPLALLAHTDTVGITAFEGDPFSGECRDGRVHGRGAADAKGPLVAGLLALELLQAAPERPPMTVLLAAVCDEEYLGRGTRKFLQLESGVQRAVVLEPTGLEIVIANNGGARWHVRTRGRAAHSSRLEEGLNAIHLMAQVIGVIRDVVNPWLLTRRHPLCSTPPANVGSIRGGGESNTVPELCEIELFVRTHPGEKPAKIVREVNELIRSSLPPPVARRVEFLKPFHTTEGFETAEADPMVQALAEAAREVGIEPRVAGRPYGSDANVLAGKGVIPVVFGPGDDRLAHSGRESVEVSEVAKAARVLAGMVTKMSSFTGQ